MPLTRKIDQGVLVVVPTIVLGIQISLLYSGDKNIIFPPVIATASLVYHVMTTFTTPHSLVSPSPLSAQRGAYVSQGHTDHQEELTAGGVH